MRQLRIVTLQKQETEGNHSQLHQSCLQSALVTKPTAKSARVGSWPSILKHKQWDSGKSMSCRSNTALPTNLRTKETNAERKGSGTINNKGNASSKLRAYTPSDEPHTEQCTLTGWHEWVDVQAAILLWCPLEQFVLRLLDL